MRLLDFKQIFIDAGFIDEYFSERDIIKAFN